MWAGSSAGYLPSNSSQNPKCSNDVLRLSYDRQEIVVVVVVVVFGSFDMPSTVSRKIKKQTTSVQEVV